VTCSKIAVLDQDIADVDGHIIIAHGDVTVMDIKGSTVKIYAISIGAVRRRIDDNII